MGFTEARGQISCHSIQKRQYRIIDPVIINEPRGKYFPEFLSDGQLTDTGKS